MAVASDQREVFIVEKKQTFGQETSNRNSQVIHAGIYYPEGTLKAKTCVEGNALIYQLCNQYAIDHRRLGELIVAIDDEETEELEALWRRGRRNGVESLEMLSRQDVKQIEPNIKAVAASFSPSSGIIDVYALMRYFLGKAKDNGAKIVYNSHYCKGEYFKLTQDKSWLVKKLVYPIPKPRATGLGIHVTPGLDGKILLEPNAYYVDTIDYSVNELQRKAFCDLVARFLPIIKYEDLEPEMAGIRPTLQEPDSELRDFVIRDEHDKGLPGFINLIGIESPGLTSCPAIAKYVGEIVEELLEG